jgi:hypothetical protein
MFLPRKSLAYGGVDDQPCFCDYLVIPKNWLPGGRPGIVFIQRSPMSTSITNSIETIVSMMLKQDFEGALPKSLRFFEYYPANLKPIFDWQEVSFAQSESHFLKNDLWNRITRKLSSAKPNYWSVDQPSWNPVGPTLKAELQHLV